MYHDHQVYHGRKKSAAAVAATIAKGPSSSKKQNTKHTGSPMGTKLKQSTDPPMLEDIIISNKENNILIYILIFTINQTNVGR